MKFLVVDDSKLARVSLIKTLKELEPAAEFLEAENGLIGLEKFKEFNMPIVFLDLTMPVMDGYEALDLMIKFNPKAEIIVVTADIQAQAQEQVMALGAKMMIPKPISTEKMLAVLQQLSM